MTMAVGLYYFEGPKGTDYPCTYNSLQLFAGSSTSPDDCVCHVVGPVVLTETCDSQARAAVGRLGASRQGGLYGIRCDAGDLSEVG